MSTFECEIKIRPYQKEHNPSELDISSLSLGVYAVRLSHFREAEKIHPEVLYLRLWIY